MRFGPRVRALVSVMSMLVVLGGTSVAHADPETDIEKGRNAYLARQYDEADSRFRAMLDPKAGSVKDPVLVSQALMLWGAVKVAQKKPTEASRLFEDLLTKDPQFEPDPLSFPTEVLDVFSDTRHRIRERLSAAARETARLEAERKAREEAEKKKEAERVARLERLAAEETVRVQRSRAVAFIPFGAGQFQNGDRTLGWGFLAAEAAFVAIGTAVVPFAVAERNAMTDSYQPAFRPDATAEAESHRQNAIRLQIVNLVAYGAFAVTAVVGVVQANVAFVPETVKVQRRSPKELDGTVPPAGAPPSPRASSPKREATVRLSPNVSGLTGGFAVGIDGRF
ncbi:MAG: hypothetical protein U0235_21535 [Polyangiaceae bacterium]